jgi:hypothetical protein
MSEKPAAFELDALVRAEAACRRRIAASPDDMDARLRLAWCLLMRALHRSGQQSALAGIAGGDDARLDSLLAHLEAVPGVSAGRLVDESLHQAFAVEHLTQDPREVADVRQLQALIALSGGGQMVSDAQDRASAVLHRLARDIERAPRTEEGVRHPG